MEKLSSGLRINKASDDAAGLTISEKMRAQIRGLNQAGENIQDGISLIQTAEGGLASIQDPNLMRLRELAVQAANDTLSNEDRQHIQKEVEQIKHGINEIANGTEFNGIHLLNNVPRSSETGTTVNWEQKNIGINVDIITSVEKLGSTYLATGVRGPSSEGLILQSTDGQAWSILPSSEVNSHLREIAYDGQNYVTVGSGSGFVGAPEGMILTSSNGTDWNSTLTSSTTSFYGVTTDGNQFVTVGENGSIMTSSNGTTWISRTSGTTERLVSVATDGNQFISVGLNGTILKSVDGINWSNKNSGSTAHFEEVAWMNNQFYAVGSNGTIVTSSDGESWSTLSSGENEHLLGITENGTELIVFGMNGTILSSVDEGVTWKKHDSNTAERIWDVKPLNKGFIAVGEPNNSILITDTSIHSPYAEPKSLNLQVGANSSNSFQVILSDARTTALGIHNIDLSTRQGAEDALAKIDKAMETVSSERGKYGAYQNALEHIQNNVSIYEVNLTAAESRIRDAELAKETMDMTKNKILSEASQAMLTQTGQLPQQVLQLLK